jgi:hypothetical protein
MPKAQNLKSHSPNTTKFLEPKLRLLQIFIVLWLKLFMVKVLLPTNHLQLQASTLISH